VEAPSLFDVHQFKSKRRGVILSLRCSAECPSLMTGSMQWPEPRRSADETMIGPPSSEKLTSQTLLAGSCNAHPCKGKEGGFGIHGLLAAEVCCLKLSLQKSYQYFTSA